MICGLPCVIINVGAGLASPWTEAQGEQPYNECPSMFRWGLPPLDGGSGWGKPRPYIYLFFAQCKATEASQYNILTCFGNHLFHKVAHNHCLILDPGLHHQYLLTQYLLELVVNDLVAF